MIRNCLEWWSHNSLQFPNLAKLAKKYLCVPATSVPATSVPAEQVFSIAGVVINNKQCSLKPENVDMLIFLIKIVLGSFLWRTVSEHL